MSNQGESVGRSIDINQLQWALRHGQKIDSLDNIVVSNQPVLSAGNHVNNSIDNDNAPEKIVLHNRILEEQIDQLEQSLNREIVSLKGEFAIVAQGTALEEQMSQLGQTLNQEILSLKSQLANITQNSAFEEKIDQLRLAFNQDIISLESQITNVAQGTAVEEQIDSLGQSLNEEISLLKSQFANTDRGTVLEEKMDQFKQSLHQDLLALKDEVAMVVQSQLNQEKVWKIAELEWKACLEDHDTKLQADVQEMQQNMMAKIEEYFKDAYQERQYNDNMLRQEVSLLTAQLAEFQQAQDNKGQLLANDWQTKMEERQTQLIEDVSYIQYVTEEIATRPQSIEAQQKLREKFFIREIAMLKEELASACKSWKSMKKACMMAITEKDSNSVEQEEDSFSSESQTRVYEKKRKRRH